MLIGISAAKQQITVVQYLCAVHGFKSLTVEALEAGAGLPERAVVVLRSEEDAELVRWGGGVVVHIDRLEAGAGLQVSPLARDESDLEVLAFDDSEACRLVRDVVALEAVAA